MRRYTENELLKENEKFERLVRLEDAQIPCAFCNGPHRGGNHRRCSMSKDFKRIYAEAEASIPAQRADESNADFHIRIIRVVRRKYEARYVGLAAELGVKPPKEFRNFAASERRFVTRYLSDMEQAA